MLEIDTLEHFLAWAATSPRAPAALQELDLATHGDLLLRDSWDGCLFLGCRISDTVAGALVASGAIVLPNIDEYAFRVHRARLYTPEELFAGYNGAAGGYTQSLDARIYQQYLRHGKQAASIRVALARRLHDHSITDGLQEFIAERRVVAIMGGHGVERSSPIYHAVADLSRQLTRHGFLVASGGGPGAMEASHLGAYLATRDDDALEIALQILRPRPAEAKPGREYADRDWLSRAWRVRQELPLRDSERPRCESLGVPTWFYGHEPPAAFATTIAKYFANSVREEGLLAMARHGVVFAPGSAGTLQEIFQDAAQNHYASFDYYSPMILMGTEFWTTQVPAWPLVDQVSRGKPYRELLALTDDLDEIVRRIRSYQPELYRG